MENYKEFIELETRALQIRRKLLKMFETGIVGHLGGSCSLVEIVTYLYFKEMNISKEQIEEKLDRDILILSKGHSVLVQYAALAELQVIPELELGRLKIMGGMLQGHPDMRKTSGIEANTGSLGQGLSISLGLALGFRLDHRKNQIFVILGDGELAEGQVWEAAMAVTNFGIDSITVIVDRNRFQATGSTAKIFSIPYIAEKWESFGWHAIVTDGHDFNSLDQAFNDVKKTKNKPCVIIADTVKGKGFPFAENTYLYHNCSLNQKELEMAEKILDQKVTEHE